MGEKFNRSVVVTLNKGRSHHENLSSDHFWMEFMEDKRVLFHCDNVLG